MGTGEDAAIELSDDMLKRIPNRGTVSLSKVREGEYHDCYHREDHILCLEEERARYVTHDVLRKVLQLKTFYALPAGSKPHLRTVPIDREKRRGGPMIPYRECGFLSRRKRLALRRSNAISH